MKCPTIRNFWNSCQAPSVLLSLSFVYIKSTYILESNATLTRNGSIGSDKKIRVCSAPPVFYQVCLFFSRPEKHESYLRAAQEFAATVFEWPLCTIRRKAILPQKREKIFTNGDSENSEAQNQLILSVKPPIFPNIFLFMNIVEHWFEFRGPLWGVAMLWNCSQKIFFFFGKDGFL